MVRLPRNKKETYRLNSRPQMWSLGLTLAMTSTLNFQGQIWNLLYLCQKWSDCQKKSKHIDWTLGLKCDHQVWSWTWPWPWIFKVIYGICCISTKSGPKVRCKGLPNSDRGDFRCRRDVDSSSSKVKSLGPGDTTWLHRPESTLAHVMATCLIAPSYYLNQC